MRLPRFRVRTLMVAVAIVASWTVATGAILSPAIERRREALEALADQHAREERRLSGLDGPLCGVCDPNPVAGAAYHARLTAKYEWAARYPWLPVTPDPPSP